MKYILILLLLFSCSKKSGPEATLSEYISERFSRDIDKNELSNYFSGKLLEELEGLDDQMIGNLNEVRQAKKKSFTIDYKRCEQKKCFLTYTISYGAKAKSGVSEREVDVKVKKIAEVQNIDEDWKITEITDIKTYYEFDSIN